VSILRLYFLTLFASRVFSFSYSDTLFDFEEHERIADDWSFEMDPLSSCEASFGILVADWRTETAFLGFDLDLVLCCIMDIERMPFLIGVIILFCAFLYKFSVDMFEIE